MALENPIHVISLVAAADLSAKQYFAVKVDSSGNAALAGAGETAIGILQNAPASGEAAQVMVLGKSKMKAGGTVAAGALVASDASAKGVTATKSATNTGDAGGATDALIGSNVLGVCTIGGASGEILEVEILHLGAVPTTAA